MDDTQDPHTPAQPEPSAAKAAATDKAKDKAPKPVKHVNPIELATTLRGHLAKLGEAQRKTVIDRTRITLLDPNTLALVLAVNRLPGVLAGADLDAALALALHGL